MVVVVVAVVVVVVVATVAVPSSDLEATDAATDGVLVLVVVGVCRTGAAACSDGIVDSSGGGDGACPAGTDGTLIVASGCATAVGVGDGDGVGAAAVALVLFASSTSVFAAGVGGCGATTSCFENDVDLVGAAISGIGTVVVVVVVCGGEISAVVVVTGDGRAA